MLDYDEDDLPGGVESRWDEVCYKLETKKAYIREQEKLRHRELNKMEERKAYKRAWTQKQKLNKEKMAHLYAYRNAWAKRKRERLAKEKLAALLATG